MKLIDDLRRIPPGVALQILLAHGMLLFASLHGGLPYVVLQGLIALELVLLNVATVPFYPERGLLRHVADLVKMSALLAFLLLFVCISYAIVAGGEHADPIATTMARWHDLRRAGVAWAAGYIVVSLVLSLLAAISSPDPRLTWMNNNLAAGGSTFVAMLFMAFVGFFGARPMAAALEYLGAPSDPDVLMISLMVGLRFFTALVAATISRTEVEAMARNPYVDGPG
ncbi:MAG: hypothetical protein ACTHK2_14815 [Dokdonella sp.]|uniref:hypothetical protein n=1 Tax=Dokdonella sp. TaxID=2291710 RepID=UPI003F7F5122